MSEQKLPNWTRVWSQGYMTSCVGAFEGNYEGPIRDLWEAFFSGMEPGARVLDIGTGNGAVALIAAEVSARSDLGLEVHGVDLADIDPAAHVPAHRDRLRTIHFHPGRPLEDTGFEPEWFQGISGQYALEYADMGRAVPELYRILAPGGRMGLVLHHPESIVARTSRAELADARFLLEDTDLFGRARALMERVAAAATPEDRRALARDPHAERLRNAFNEAAARVEAEREARGDSDFLRTTLVYIGQAWHTLQRGQPEAALEQLATGRADLESNAARLEDLLAACQSPEAMDELRRLLDTAGFGAIAVTELRHDAERLMGWHLHARRPG